MRAAWCVFCLCLGVGAMIERGPGAAIVVALIYFTLAPFL